MIADKSRRAILICALLAARTIALGAPTALAANAEGGSPLHGGPWPIHNGRNHAKSRHIIVGPSRAVIPSYATPGGVRIYRDDSVPGGLRTDHDDPPAYDDPSKFGGG